MQTTVDSRLREEAAKFTLCFTCPRCVHFVPERRACANGYPTGAHLDIDVETRPTLEFCKEFELA